MDDLLPPGTLWSAIRDRSEQAIRCGALHTIRTEQRFVEDGGVRFLVRSVSSLERKAKERLRSAAAREISGKPFNPFLPPEPALTVGGISESHVAVLNKFNVLNHHLLIVTREFEHQECPLTLTDFEALARCLEEFDGLGFYNGGVIAGASQPHKHLQLIPLPLIENIRELPITPLLEAVPWGRSSRTLPGLPFPHAFTPLGPATTPADILLRYRELSQQVGTTINATGPDGPRTSPYNLLITRRWLLLVPRTAEFYRTISVNSLGFAGSLFVRTEEEMEWVRQAGPMRILQQVTGAR
jgi:ATP adenylyltransferase